MAGPPNSILKINCRQGIYHIEISPETPTSTLTSTENLEGFDIEYTCPNCLARNSSTFTGFPDSVSVFCSSCQQSYVLCDFSEEVVMITRKIEEIFRGVRQLCRDAHISHLLKNGEMSIGTCLTVPIVDSILRWLPVIIFTFGLFTAIVGIFIPKFAVFLGFLAFSILLLAVTDPTEILTDIQKKGRTMLIHWFTRKSGRSVSEGLVKSIGVYDVFRWKL